jgi:CRP-like cAMP-binding protein
MPSNLGPPSGKRYPSNAANLLQCIKFLQKYRGSEELVDMTRHLKLESFKPKTVIFRQGDVGDKFYIILDGKVTVFIDKPSEVSSFTLMVAQHAHFTHDFDIERSSSA